MDKSWRELRLLVGSLGLLGLLGCASQSGSSVPIEDRSAGASRASAVTAAAVERSDVIIPAPAPAFTPAPAAARPSAITPHSSASGGASAVAGGYAGSSPVLLALMEQADALKSRGDQQGALAQLERAQRIAPRDPLVYLQLARLRLQMSDRLRAEQLARRGLSLAQGDQDLVSVFEAMLVELQRR